MIEKKDKPTSEIVVGHRKVKLYVPRQEISFAVTEDCNLKCSYCYLHSKNTGRKMSFETARRAADYLLGDTHYFTAPVLSIDFIGGEPFLEIELMDQITDYIKVKLFKMNNRWFDNYIVAFSTNGTLYHLEAVQKYIEKNKNRLFPAISLDGVEEKHDNARKYRDGRGSYRDVVKNARLMIKQLPQTTIKATFGSGDIKYFKDSFLHFLELGFPLYNIYANVAYEDLWAEGDELLFEEQLIELADYLIDNNLVNSEDYGQIFSPFIGKPYAEDQLSKHWCNTGNGLIVGVDGAIYPCIRFLEMAFKDSSCARKLGDIYTGIDFDKLRPFRVLALKNCSPPECLECRVATGCNMCSGQAAADSEFGSIFNRPTFICRMHKARVRANDYFWQKLGRKEGKELNKISYSRLLNTPGKKILNVLLSTDSPAICCYQVPGSLEIKKKDLLPLDKLKEYIRSAKENGFYLNFIYPNHELDEDYITSIDKEKFQSTRPYRGENTVSVLEDGELFIFKAGEPIAGGFSCVNAIVHFTKEQIQTVSEYIRQLFTIGIIRINLLIDDLSSWDEKDIDSYREKLTDMKNCLIDFFSAGKQKSLNVLTDRLFLDRMNNCNAGLEHLTLAPDGEIYLCPAFYYYNRHKAIKGLEGLKGFSVSAELERLLKLDNAPICLHCDAYHCQRCYSRNLYFTGEINVPGEKQCVTAHLEREAARQLQEELETKKIIPFPNRNRIPPLQYRDPFQISKVW